MYSHTLNFNSDFTCGGRVAANSFSDMVQAQYSYQPTFQEIRAGMKQSFESYKSGTPKDANCLKK